ncbi:MAG: PDZ domain-containing protein, partial [Planctomycetota bacterium]
ARRPLGGPHSAAHRAHPNDEGPGLNIPEVLAGSPAEEAGLQQHDILLRAAGKQITGMSDLVELVGEVGPLRGRIAVELIRAGARQTSWVKPAERPAGAFATAVEEQLAPWAAGNGAARPGGILGLGQPGQPLRLRMLGPGVVVDGPNGNLLADGVSVAVTTEDGQTRVRVQRGEQEWDFNAGDAKALGELPQDIRVMVEGMLGGGGPGGLNLGNLTIDAQDLMPRLEGFFGGQRADRPAGLRGRRGTLQEQVREMQQQLEELRRLLGAQGGAAGGGGVAPGFRPDQVDDSAPPVPAEIEVPVE